MGPGIIDVINFVSLAISTVLCLTQGRCESV